MKRSWIKFSGIFFSILAALLCLSAQAQISTHYDGTYLKNVAQQILLLTDQEAALRHKMEQLAIERQRFSQYPPATYQEAKELQNQIKMRDEMTSILVEELSQSLRSTQNRTNKLAEFQKDLQVRLINEQLQEEKEVSTNKLRYADKLINLNQQENDLLTNNLALAQNLKEAYQQYLDDCGALIQSMEKKQVIQALHQQMKEEQKAMDFWLQKMNDLNEENGNQVRNKMLENATSTQLLGEQVSDESRLFYYTQQVHLSSIKILLLEASINEKKIEESFNNIQQDTSKNTDITVLKDYLDEESATLVDALNTLKQYQQLMKKQLLLLQNALDNHWLTEEKTTQLKNNVNVLEVISNNLEKALWNKQKAIQVFQVKLQDYTTQMVAKRQAILETTHGKRVVTLLRELAALPKLLLMYFLGLWEQVWHGLILISLSLQLLMGLALAATAVIWWLGRKYFYILSQKMSDKRQRTASNVIYILSELFRRNWGTLCLFVDGWFILRMAGMNFSAYMGLFYTALIWFSFRVIMGIARIVLVERGSDTQGQDVSLYHRLKWVFIIGGWVTVFVVLSKQFDLGGIIMEISNRLFMAFLLTVSIVLIRARRIIPTLLEPFLLNRNYLSRTVRTVCWFLPFGFFISTALGVLGYINLAWVLIYYQASLVLVVASYIILRGMSTDLFDISSEWVIRRLNQGWLWSEAFLKPLDRLVRIFLFFAMLVGVSLVLGWGNDSLVVTKMRELFHHTFFRFSGIDVTLFSIIEFIALVSFFFWLAKWTREFSHRWLFRNAKDIGVRNSLAVFCQYIIITLGIIITLQILGIDFSGLSMILGGLAVGLGFGLRDFANSIVGGIMILIERTVKEGDIVSVGEYEGEVIHIGIRAMRIRSWDYMEIMVPNSEILMKTFINWTHQDSIVRTVIPMKIHRVDDPAIVQKMILDLLHQIPEVLAQPEAEVFFTNMNDALIEFEVRYFINISLWTRSKIRSKVLLMIITAFKEAGIRPPYSQQDSYVWHTDEGDSHEHWKRVKKAENDPL